jgi:hypothetical protein
MRESNKVRCRVSRSAFGSDKETYSWSEESDENRKRMKVGKRGKAASNIRRILRYPFFSTAAMLQPEIMA